MEFNIYPQYTVKSMITPDLSQKKIQSICEDRLKSLREALMSNEDVEVVHKYFVSLPTEEAHHKCHPTKGVMGLSQRVHPEVIAKIHELVSIGTVEPVEVQRLLKHHVNHYMCAGNLPDSNNRAYFPCLDDIKNHIAKAKRALQLSVVDQENAAKIIEKQQKSFRILISISDLIKKRTQITICDQTYRTWTYQTLKVPYYGFTKKHGNSN